MSIIRQAPDGTILSQSWTEDSLREWLASIRYDRETMGFSIEGQDVTTYRDEMAVWIGMYLNATTNPLLAPYPEVPLIEYKPRGGVGVLLSPNQVKRGYELWCWYVAECFKVERVLAAKIGSVPLETIATEARLEATWPARELTWIRPPS